eukprot:m.42325 g.42325  ORF g.42325 m.42325 type:complete len:403 (+) comp6259_c0_seq2:1-1209(+)
MNVCVDLGTSAVMHRDPNNQLNCVVYDSKRWTLIDMASMSDLPLVWEDGVPPLHNTGGTVEFDFESVDLIRYPSLATIPYAQAVVEEGDCIFIPGSYPHHVHSPGHNWSHHPPIGVRNLQVSFLFRGRTAVSQGTRHEPPPVPYTPTACDAVPLDPGSIQPLSNHPVAWQYPGHGPFSMGGMLPQVCMSIVTDAVTSFLTDKRLLTVDMTRSEWTKACGRAVVREVSHQVSKTKGLPHHDFHTIADAIDIALRDSDINIGPSGPWMQAGIHAVPDLAHEHPTYVIPGLRKAVLKKVGEQSRRFCNNVSLSGTTEESDKVATDTVASGAQWLAQLEAVQPIRCIQHMLMLYTAMTIADCQSFASHVRLDNGRWHTVVRRQKQRLGSDDDEEEDEDDMKYKDEL